MNLIVSSKVNKYTKNAHVCKLIDIKKTYPAHNYIDNSIMKLLSNLRANTCVRVNE